MRCLLLPRDVAFVATVAFGLLLASPVRADVPATSDENYKRLSLEQLMDLDVTSVTRAPEPYAEAPAAIDVVTQDQIRRSGASSIPEALELADNLEVAQKNTHDWAISARGFNTALSNKLLVMMDGRTVYTPLFSGVFWDVQDTLLEDIDRIEVISGPGGSLWGANAVNGVINITSKSAKDTLGGYLEAGGGNELRAFAGARYGVTVAPSVFLRVYGKSQDRVSGVLANGKSANNGERISQGGFRLDSAAVANTALTLQGDLYSGHQGIVTGGDARVSGENVLGRLSRTGTANSDMSLQVYYDRTHLVDPIPASAFAPFGYLTDTLDTLDVDFQHHFRWGGRQGIVWGLGFRYTRDVLVNAPALAFLPPELEQNLYSGFVQDEVALAKDVALTFGTKVEHNDYTGAEFEPSARLKWNPAPHQMIWGAVSRAVRTPSRVDRDIAQPKPPPTFLLGGADFASETVIAYELGYRAGIGPNLSGSVSAYYNTYDHVRSLGFTPVTILPLVFQNNLKGHTQGVETNLTYQALPWWRWHAGWDVLRESIQVKPGRTDLNNALNETADPENQWALRSSMDLPGGLGLDAALRRVDSLRINNGGAPATTPGYTELNARLSWQATPRLELSLVGQNLLHRVHVEYGVPALGQEEIARSVYGKAAWHF